MESGGFTMVWAYDVKLPTTSALTTLPWVRIRGFESHNKIFRFFRFFFQIMDPNSKKSDFFVLFQIVDPNSKYSDPKYKNVHHLRFPRGPPPQYWAGPMVLNFGVRMGSGGFTMVWAYDVRERSLWSAHGFEPHHRCSSWYYTVDYNGLSNLASLWSLWDSNPSFSFDNGIRIPQT